MNNPSQIVTVDLMKLMGADVIQTKRGNWAYVLNLNQSNAQVLQGRAQDRTPQVVYQFRGYPSHRLHNEQTHYFLETIAPDRYAAGARGLIIGTGRTF